MKNHKTNNQKIFEEIGNEIKKLEMLSRSDVSKPSATTIERTEFTLEMTSRTGIIDEKVGLLTVPSSETAKSEFTGVIHGFITRLQQINLRGQGQFIVDPFYDMMNKLRGFVPG
jgi:hypothetical protein